MTVISAMRCPTVGIPAFAPSSERGWEGIALSAAEEEKPEDSGEEASGLRR